MKRLRFLDPSRPLPPARPPGASAARLLALEEGPGAEAARRALREAPDGSEADRAALYRDRGEAFAGILAEFLGGLNAANAGFEWWAFGLSGKNPLTLRFPRRMFQLSLIVAEAEASPEGGELWVVSSDAVLAREALRWARERGMETSPAPRRFPGLKKTLNRWTPSGPAAGLLRALWRRFLARKARGWKPDPGRAYAVFATWIHPGCFGPDGAYRDPFFGELPGRLAEKGECPVFFAQITRSFRECLGRVADPTAGPVLPMDAFPDWADLWECFSAALYRRFVDFPVRGALACGGLDAAALLREELRENARESRFFSDLCYHACARALLRRVRARSFYYPFENLARERMMLWALRGSSPRTRAVGYQHAALTRNHLNFLLGDGEARVLPLPDKIVTLGDVTREFMIGRGRFPASLVETGCALRQARLPARVEERAGVLRPPRLLVALATSERECADVLLFLDRAYSGREGVPEIVLRPHPLFPLSEGLRLSGPVRFPYRDGSGQDPAQAFSAADIVLYASSTMGLEAVRRGLPAVFLDLGNWLSLDPLFELRDYKWSVETPAALVETVEGIRSLPPERARALRWSARGYAGRYCREVTPLALEPFFTPAKSVQEHETILSR